MKRQAMAAQYTAITEQEMKTSLQRAFRALQPTFHVMRGEMVADLALNDQKTLGVRVWTSITGAGSGADVGTDAIRVQFYNFATGRPLLTGKAPIVKRTQNWRDNLKERIEDIIEMYDSREAYWESRV